MYKLVIVFLEILSCDEYQSQKPWQTEQDQKTKTELRWRKTETRNADEGVIIKEGLLQKMQKTEEVSLLEIDLLKMSFSPNAEDYISLF